MIILEFRSPEFFRNAAEALKNQDLPCVSEPSAEAWQPSLLFLFEDTVRTEAQRSALRRARDLEKEDRRIKIRSRLPNLALPS